LPPSAVIVSYASPEGRQVVLADANPAILALPTVSALSLEEAGEAQAGSAAQAADVQASETGAPQAGPGRWQPPADVGDRGAAGGTPVEDDVLDDGAPAEDTQPPRPGAPAPVNWRSAKGRPPPNIGPPPEPLDWRKHRGR
jgi:hypothetical protein